MKHYVTENEVFILIFENFDLFQTIERNLTI